MAQETFNLSNVEALAFRFAAKHLDEYTARLRAHSSPFRRKEINDALWGTIGLTAVEVVMLDSPLLQRLRYVRQLGVVHWVYPGAVHTRFEHTLGVLFQAQHLMTALNAQATVDATSTAPLIDPSFVQLIRLCALLHDVGHTAFSHVAEMAVEALPEMSTISAEFSTQRRIERRQLSEIFAFYIVRSPAMRRLVELMFDRCGAVIALDTDRNRNLDLTIEKISDAIIGRKIDDRLPLLHEIISGPFDADKLDYFVRDARLAGTPSVVDISRLVQKLTIRHLDAAELPSDISRNVKNLDTKYCLFGMKWSGIAVLDELHLARVLLFAKIYRHPKVVAIEQMLRAAILTLARIATAESVVSFLYDHADDSLLSMNLATLAVSLRLDPQEMEAEDQNRLADAAETLTAIRDRRLWVRCFQIQGRYPADHLEGKQHHKEALIEFLEHVEHPQKRELFMTSLLDEVHVIVGMLNRTNPPNRTSLESQVMIHTLGPTPGGTQIARAYLLPPGSKPMPFREYMVNRTAWADSYLSDQPKGFIFSTPQLADAVFLAVEKLVRRDFDLRLPTAALEVSKRNAQDIDAAKKALESGGYYRGVPFDIRPLPDRLLTADVPIAVQQFDALRSTYQEPQGTDQSGFLQSQDRTMAWLRQFVTDEHVDCAMRILAHFRMLTRHDTILAIRTFIDQHPEFLGAWVVPFGSAKDSSVVQTYFSADLQGTYIAGCATLEEVAKANDQSPVIFIDDFVGTGRQAQDILAAGFNDLPLRNEDLGEQRSMFEDEVQVHLRKVKLGFVFTAAWDEGIETVGRTAKSLGLDATVFRLIDESKIPFAFDCLAGVDARVVESFRDRCREIGIALLANTGDGDTNRHGLSAADQKKQFERALGYGNRAMLLASSFNVPSQTLTAIWAQGKYDGVKWTPLLVRRKKQ